LIYDWLSNVDHRFLLSSYVVVLSALRFKATIIQQHQQPLSSAELVEMVAKTTINCAITYGTVLEEWIRNARTDRTVLKALQKLDTVRYTGVAISEIDMKWALNSGIKLMSMFVSTEAGELIHSKSSPWGAVS
jgi:hypothetical protein